MNSKIYFDNACTSFPKPADVSAAMVEYMNNIGVNINRGCYNSAYSVEETVFETRELLCDMFHGSDSKNVVFTSNVTEALNFAIKGLLKSGDHVLVSSMEHNAVMRPLTQLAEQGVTFDRIICDADGTLDANDIESMIKANTKAIIMLHGSNVCGTLLPIKEVGSICKKNKLFFIVDSAQTAGVFPINMEEMNIDILCFTGHKGLLGPQGIGGLILKERMIDILTPLISGGTGSISHTEEIPTFMPDRFEAGTPNLPGIIGLNASLKWIQGYGMNQIQTHELDLTSHMLEELIELEKKTGLIRIIGKRDITNRGGVISITTLQHELSEVAYALDTQFDIMTRVGLHCAPSAHKTLGTYPTGTLRFSFGINNTHDEIDRTMDALKQIISLQK